MTNEQQALRKEAKDINKEWKAKSAAKTVCPYDRPNSYLKRSVYEFVRSCLSTDDGAMLRMAVTGERPLAGARGDTGTFEDNPFFWGLLLVCGDNGLTKSSRSRFSLELQYANMHNVPPQYLIGFLYQMGTSDGLAGKIADGTREQWFVEKNAEDEAAASEAYLKRVNPTGRSISDLFNS